MDTGYTFGSPAGDRISLNLPPDFDPPTEITVEGKAGPVTFDRISDSSLICGKTFDVTGECRTWECHRQVLGECQCGRHPGGVRMSRVVPR